MGMTFKFPKTGLVAACLLVALVGSPVRAQSEASVVVSGAAAGSRVVAGATAISAVPAVHLQAPLYALLTDERRSLRLHATSSRTSGPSRP